MARLKRLFSFIADALFPRACVLCKEEGEILCAACAQNVKLPAWHQQKEIGSVVIFSRVSYKEPAVQKLLHAWKYQGDASAGTWWKTWMQEGDLSCFGTNPLYIPVPLAKEAYAERGFNQAKELARALAERTGGEMRDILERHPRKSQAKTSKTARAQVVTQNPYEWKRGEHWREEGRLVWIVDDVATTGSTLVACAEILRKGGVQNIAACTLAYGNDP